MQFRFRFLNEAGEEVQVESTEELSRHFDEGRLTRETLLYDAITQEWAPARSHPVFRLIADAAGIQLSDDEGGPAEEEAPVDGNVDRAEDGEDSDDGEDGEESADGADAEAGSPADDSPLLDIELTPQGEPEEDTIAAFLAERERERREAEMSGRSDSREVVIADETIAPVHRTPQDFRTAPSEPAKREEPAPVPRHRGGTPLPPVSEARVPPSEDTRRIVEPRDTGRRSGVRRVLDRFFARARLRRNRAAAHAGRRQTILFALLLAVGGWGIYDAWNAPTVSAAGVTSVLPVEIAPPERPAPSMEAARSAAFQDMVRGMDRLRGTMGLEEPPNEWMSGAYLADAGAYPEVLDYWQLYQQFVLRLRAEEEELFRSGFVRRMQTQGITGAVLSLRVASAMRDFQADAPRRHMTYAAMDELADAALDLHGFLLENTDRIDSPDLNQPLAEDPVLAVVPGDEAIRTELWSRIERLLEGLDQVAGPDPQRRRDVSQRVLGDLADVGEDDAADSAGVADRLDEADTLGLPDTAGVVDTSVVAGPPGARR